MDLLQQARETINDIDAQMAALFEQRMRAVQAVAEYKKEHGLPILDAAREEAVLRRGALRVEDSVLQEYYIDFMKNTMAVSRRYQQRLLTGMRVAYSGTEGAFAHIAAGRLFPEAQKIGFPDFAAAYDAVVQGDCDAVVLPLENSSAGEVGQVTDLLFSGPLYVSTVLPMPIKHDLLALEGTTPETVRTVVSHPQALAQCDEYIRAHGYEQLPYANTALAAKYVAELGDPAVAAIGSVECAAACGLKPVAEAINGSQLPPSILEQIIAPIHQQIAQAAQQEIAQAEKEYNKEGEQNAESN